MLTSEQTPALCATAVGLPERGELLARLATAYGVPQGELAAFDRSGLLRIVDTFDFLVQHLPVDSAVRVAQAALRLHLACPDRVEKPLE